MALHEELRSQDQAWMLGSELRGAADAPLGPAVH